MEAPGISQPAFWLVDNSPNFLSHNRTQSVPSVNIMLQWPATVLISVTGYKWETYSSVRQLTFKRVLQQ